MTGGDRLPGIDGEPKLELPYPCCRHCDHPVHPQFTGHASACWACEVAALLERVRRGEVQVESHPREPPP